MIFIKALALILIVATNVYGAKVEEGDRRRYPDSIPKGCFTTLQCKWWDYEKCSNGRCISCVMPRSSYPKPKRRCTTRFNCDWRNGERCFQGICKMKAHYCRE